MSKHSRGCIEGRVGDASSCVASAIAVAGGIRDLACLRTTNLLMKALAVGESPIVRFRGQGY